MQSNVWLHMGKGQFRQRLKKARKAEDITVAKQIKLVVSWCSHFGTVHLAARR